MWHLLSGEAPGAGGIGDYTAVLAEGLRAAGEEARVWTERRPRELDAALGAFPAPRRILFQYAPQAWGARGMNLAVCRWLLGRRRAGDEVRVMFHEPFFPFGWQRPRRNLLALVNRAMARTLLGAAERAYVSTAAWEPLLRPLAPSGLSIALLPVPSTVPFVDDPAAVAGIRAELSEHGAKRIVAHFGTYGGLIAPLLTDAIGELVRRRSDVRLLLLGRGGADFAARLPPSIDAVAPGEMDARALSLHLQAADTAIQPYPDGVDTRRTTMMACLANGVPTATTRGRFTDGAWTGAPVCFSDDAAGLAKAVEEAERVPDATEIRGFYRSRFSVERTVERLLGDG